MPYYNHKRAAKNIQGMKKSQSARRRKKRGVEGMSKPYDDMSGNMTHVRKSHPEKKRFRIRYDKM